MSCAGCGSVSSAIAYGEAHEIVRGLVSIGPGVWICPTCTRKANARFAAVANAARTCDRDVPPPDFV